MIYNFEITSGQSEKGKFQSCTKHLYYQILFVDLTSFCFSSEFLPIMFLRELMEIAGAYRNRTYVFQGSLFVILK